MSIYHISRPLTNQVLIQRDVAPSISEGGIHLSQVTQEQNSPGTATILAVSKAVEGLGDLKPGDRVRVKKMTGIDVPWGDGVAESISFKDVLVGIELNLPSTDQLIEIIQVAIAGDEKADRAVLELGRVIEMEATDVGGEVAALMLEVQGYIDEKSIRATEAS